ncbi:MAG: hypothetical protein CTY15_05310 [Methylocystis sp.]|nr:MAG: hypothetical protein CTY15_05310 [Methylocystis sp.]
MPDARDDDRKSRSPLLAPWRVLRAHARLVISAATGVSVGLAFPLVLNLAAPGRAWLPAETSAITSGLVGWNAAVLVYFVLAAMLLLSATHESIRKRAEMTDEGRTVILFLTAAATCVAIGAILAELGQSKTFFEEEKGAHVALAVITVFTSWAFMHLIFAFHYAHEFYSEAQDATQTGTARGGLHFPNTPAPQYIDFLYFSYVIGVAFQTADVEICSRPMRVVALAHGVVAFFFNTTILALMVNISSGLV